MYERNDYEYDSERRQRQSYGKSTYERRARTAERSAPTRRRRVDDDYDDYDDYEDYDEYDASPRSRRSTSVRSTSARSSSRGASPRQTARTGRGATSRSTNVGPASLNPASWISLAIAFAAGAIIAAIIVVLVMSPAVDQAKLEANEAKAEVKSLTDELEQLQEQLLAQDSANSTSSTSTSSTSALSNTDTVSQAGVESPWIKKGTFTTGDKVLDEETKAFVDAFAPSDKKVDEAALEMYKSLAWSDYTERDTAQHPKGSDWRETYAKQYFENGNSGNCYEFAAALMYCLQYMGFDDAKAEAIELELQSGSWGDHGIVFVTDTDGEKRMCDTARGTDGWMISTGAYNYRVVDVENEE